MRSACSGHGGFGCTMWTRNAATAACTSTGGTRRQLVPNILALGKGFGELLDLKRNKNKTFSDRSKEINHFPRQKLKKGVVSFPMRSVPDTIQAPPYAKSGRAP